MIRGLVPDDCIAITADHGNLNGYRGKLAYGLISKLFADEKITAAELEKMLTKEYTKKFRDINYPIIALDRNAHKGNSSKCRYYAKPVKYHGQDIFISWEWFDESRDDLAKWFKSFY